jgi:hypothetical protein
MLDERFAQILRDMERRSVDAMRQIDRRFVDVLMEMREGIATILQRLSLIGNGVRISVPEEARPW